MRPSSCNWPGWPRSPSRTPGSTRSYGRTTARKDEFLAMLAHELRNPLAAIGNAVQLVQAEALGQEHIDWGDGCHHPPDASTSRGSSTTCWTSPASPAGKIELRRERSTSTPILDSAVETVQPARRGAEAHSSTVSLDRGALCGSTPTRRGSSRSSSNLLTNAAKYTRERRPHLALGPTRGGRGRHLGAGHGHRHPARDAAPRCSSCSPRETARSPAPRVGWGSA